MSSTAERERVDGPADALALAQSEFDGRPEVDATVQPGQRRLLRSVAEGVETASRQPAFTWVWSTKE